jgi:imidazolonepropionase-like amidohydrolase
MFEIDGIPVAPHGHKCAGDDSLVGGAMAVALKARNFDHLCHLAWQQTKKKPCRPLIYKAF